jgi:hypothetical protein
MRLKKISLESISIMKHSKLWLITVALLLLFTFSAQAQKTKSQKPAKKSTVQKSKTQAPAKKPAAKKTTAKTPEKVPPATEGLSTDAAANEKKVRDIVAFLEYMLNTLGSSGTSTRDKTVLVTESYSKIFRDAKVQVEDDLDEDRDVITNKDVVAYLKDVDFFFNDVKFEFAIDNIQSKAMGTGAQGNLFYKVSLRRNLTGTTAEGKPVSNTMPRYIEVNYSPEDQDLRIVSIYTNEFDEKEALANWWKELSYEWQGIFKRKLNLLDSVTPGDLQKITSIEELDLTGNQYIQNIEPLAQLVNLRTLKLSATAINDITPIRNLTELEELNLFHTKVQDLTPLKYSNKIKKLNIGQTGVSDITVVEKMAALQSLEMSGTPVVDFNPVSNLTSLQKIDLKATRIPSVTPLEKLVNVQELNISQTPVTDLGPLKGFKNLSTLTIDSTRIVNIAVLSSLENLRVLSANYTQVSDLQPLQKLTHLEKIYCDQTPVSRKVADAFMAANPKVLVIFDSRDLKAWWGTLSPEWQQILGKTAGIGATTNVPGEPSKDELAKVTNLDSINFGGNASIRDLEPLRKLLKLHVVMAAKTGIKDLAPLQEHTGIRYLDISETDVSSLSVVSQFTKLEVLKADRSKIESIEPLYTVTSLKEVYVDLTNVHDIIAREFLEKNPKCLLVHKTVHLKRWWGQLPGSWKDVFRTQMEKDTIATRENLHKLVERETLNFKDASVTDLSALSEFVRLKELHFSGTPITTIPPLENIKSLKSLHATHGPLIKIESLSQFTDLEDLDISNTPVDELKPIGNLKNLKNLNCAGTQIKNLNALETLQALESVDCSNTNVNRLDPIMALPLKTLKCYNTKVTTKRIEDFKSAHPDCNVIYYR